MPSQETYVHGTILRLARRLARRPLVVLAVATALTVGAVWVTQGLHFTSDLTRLLPDDHPALVTLRKVQGKSAGETAFMVLVSRNYLFAVDKQGVAHIHDARMWHRYPLGKPLYAVFGSDADDAYAGGEGGYLARFDGKRWTPVSTPARATIRGLFCAGRGDLTAVGDGGMILERRRGGPFRLVSSGVKTPLLSVTGWVPTSSPASPTSAPTSAPTTNSASTPLPSGGARGGLPRGGVVRYAVGEGGVVLEQRGLGPWVRLPSPGAVTLRAAWVASTGALHVVGDGGAWFVREMSSSSAATWRRLKPPKGETLRAISGSSAKDVYAVGDHGVAFHFDGKTVRAERTTTEQTLYGIRILDFDKIWAAGDRCTVRRRIPGRLWYHGPVETKPFKPTLLPPIFKHKPTCHSDLRAIWRPHNDLRKAKTLVTRLATRYRRSKLVGRIQIHRPVKFFEDRALYFLGVEDLRELTTEISDRLDKEAGKRSGIVVDLEDDDDDVKPTATGQGPTSSGAASKNEESPRIKKLYERFRHLATRRGRSPWYLHPDGASVGLLVVSRPHAGLTDLRRLRELLRREALDALPKAGDAMLQIDVGGDGENKILEYDATLADITGLVWLAVIGIVLLLVIYFRRLVGILFVIVPLAMSIAWTFALTTWAIGTLNIITAFLFAVLFGLGIDFGLQFYGRYREERLLGASVDEALDRCVFDTGQATLTSAVTSSAALLSLLVTDFRGFSEFGFIAGIGIILAFISFVAVQPAMIVIAENLHLLRLQKAKGKKTREARPLLATRFRRPVLLVAALATAWGIYGMTQTRFEYNNAVLRPDRGGNEIQYRANNMLGGSFTPTQFIAADRDHLRAGLDAIERHRKALGKASTVGGTMSILDLVPRRQHEKEKLLGGLRRVLARRTWRHVSAEKKRQIHYDELRGAAKAKPFDVADLPVSIRRSFHGPGFGDRWIGLATYHVNISDTREARRFKDEVGAVKGSPFVDLGAILPKGARSWVDGSRVEIAAGQDRDLIARKLRGLTHGGKMIFAKVLRADAAVAAGIAVDGGLRGDLLAVAAPGFVPRAAGVPGAPVVVPSGVFKVTSSEIVLTDVVEVMLHDSKIAFVLSISAVFLACLLDFRKLRLAILASLPLTVGLLWTFGVLHLFSMKLNMFNFIMLPVLVGIGIDYGVHFVHRYESEGPEQLDWVGRQLRWVLLFCSATTIVGFGNMSLATHPGLRSLGTLAVIGLVSMFLASTVALPALLASLGKKKR